jgi:peptidoglycan biosynthesis protein MviN/MurJ (putative lipid II flippase)
LRVLVASVAMICLVQYLNSSTEHWFMMDLGQRVANLSLLVVTGIGSYFVIIMLLGLNIKQVIRAPKT